jgi:ABC-2 type transport system permease protein
VRWLSDYWVVGVIVVVLILAVAGLTGILGTSSAQSPGELRALTLQAATAQLPVCLLFLGYTLLVFARCRAPPSRSPGSLSPSTAILGVFGPLLQAPEWLVRLSPFAHSPVPAGDATDWADGIWMLGIGAGAAVLALASIRRRELAPGA